MKFNFKKIASVIATTVMLGSTVAFAAAAWPAPFVNNGAAASAVVYGANSADLTAAADLGAALDAGVTSVSSEITGGDSFTLEKSSDKFYFNEALNSSYASLDADELSAGLAKGVYDNEDIENVDYEQKITLGSKVLSLFTDNNYRNNEPSVGFWFTNGQNVLTYTIDFDDGELNYTEMPESDMPLLGKEYYVLTATATKIELLDSADSVILTDGETKVVNGKSVSIDWIDTDEVILNVDGTATKKLSSTNRIEDLSDGTYVAVTNILASSRESTQQKVEFSIGSGKIILENGKDVIIGEDSDDKIRGLVATITESGGFVNAISLAWNSKDNTFLTQTNPIVMPGLEGISLIYNGLNYASDSETITLDGGSETLTLEMGNFDIPLMWYNVTGNVFVQGEENYPLKIDDGVVTNTTAGYGGSEVTPWGEYYNTTIQNISSSALTLTEDDRFIVTLVDPDLSDVETLYYQVSDIDVDGADILVELEDLVGSNDLKWDGTIATRVGDTDEAGDVTVTLAGFNDANDTIYLEFTSGVVFNKVVSEKGLVATIPVTNASAITFVESDKDDDVNEGVTFTATVSASTNEKISVTLGTANVTKEETLANNKYTAIVNSELASKISTDESGDEYDLSIEYFGKEAVADVRVAVGTDVTTSSGSVKVVKDTEVDSVSSMNLVVVGGSCINTVAAKILESETPLCGDAWSAKTGASAGKFLVQVAASPYNANKIAMLVAGYDAADTVNAVAKVKLGAESTEVGSKTVYPVSTA